MRIKQLAKLSQGPFSPDNLHRIAISNLSDQDRILVRWWCRKYKTPLKPLNEHTQEELIIEMLEDYYEKNPAEKDKFLKAVSQPLLEEKWDGKMSDEYEREMQKRFARKPLVDDSRFKSNEVLTPEQERDILDNLGRNLPGSKRVINQTKRSDEFEEEFGEL